MRGYSARTEASGELPYNMTLVYVDEQQAKFTLQFGAGSPSDPRIFVNGTILDGVALDNTNVTEGGNFWTYTAGNVNRIDVHNAVGTAQNFTVYFPQNPDTAFATQGRLLEGNFLNTLTTEQEEIFYSYLELYNPSSTVIAELITDLKVDQQKAYEIIGKINKTGIYTADTSLQKGGGFFKDLYKSSTSIDDFYDNLLQKVRDTADQVIIGDGD